MLSIPRPYGLFHWVSTFVQWQDLHTPTAVGLRTLVPSPEGSDLLRFTSVRMASQPPVTGFMVSSHSSRTAIPRLEVFVSRSGRVLRITLLPPLMGCLSQKVDSSACYSEIA
jgi:hypothetical protein